MGNVNAGIVIDGVIDGTTVGYEIVVVYGNGDGPSPLEQWYDDHSGECSPDWAAAWSELQQQGVNAERLAKIPRLFIKARDHSTGTDVTQSLRITKVNYNGTDYNWANDGTAANGIIKMVMGGDYGYKYGANSQPVPTVMFIGNPADALSNPDSDRVSFEGTVTVDGAQVGFKGLGKDVDIHPYLSGDVGYTVHIAVPSNVDPYIPSKQATTQRIAALRHNGSFVNQGSTPHIIKFYDATGATDRELVNAANRISLERVAIGGEFMPTTGNNKITIYPNAVDSMMTLRVSVYAYENGIVGRLLASSLAAIYDLSDEYQVKWKLSDNANFGDNVEVISNENLSEGPRFLLRRGETKYMKPAIVTGKDGAELAGNRTWKFNADDPTTNVAVTDMSDARINNQTPGQQYCYIQYSDVVKNNKRRPVKIHAQTEI